MNLTLELLALAVVHGSLAAALAWALDAGLRGRISPALSSALWTIALAKFFVPFGPVATSSLAPSLAPASMAFAPLELTARAGAAAPGLSWPALLCAAYLLGVTALGAARLLSARRLSRSLAALPEASPALLASVREAAALLGLRRLPAVRTGAGPFIAGLWGPTLVVPFERAEGAEARAMLLHELAHLRRFDPLVRALQNLASIAFFFWPPVRWVNGKIEQHRELACDQLALAHGGLSAAGYARLLLEAQRSAQRGPWRLAVLEMSSRASRLEQRIDGVLALDRRRSPRWSALAWFGGALLALSGGALAVDAGSAAATIPPREATAAQAPANVEPETQAQIREVVRAHRAQIRACYEAALLAAPGLEGKLVYGWSITPAGAVGDGCVESSDLTTSLGTKPSPTVEDQLWHCVSAAIFHWQFPAPKSGEKVEVSYPFVFKQAGGPDVPMRRDE